MKVIRSPIVYEAEQFHSKGNIPEGVKKYHDIYVIEDKAGIPNYPVIDGDWLVTDPDGNIEPYSEEEFRRIFERVE